MTATSISALAHTDLEIIIAPEGAPAFEPVGASVKRRAELRAGLAYQHESGFMLSADTFGEVSDIAADVGRIELSRRFGD